MESTIVWYLVPKCRKHGCTVHGFEYAGRKVIEHCHGCGVTSIGVACDCRPLPEYSAKTIQRMQTLAHIVDGCALELSRAADFRIARKFDFWHACMHFASHDRARFNLANRLPR